MVLFTPQEAKEFRYQGQTPLAAGFSDDELTDVEARIAESFRDICGVAFVPTTSTVTVDGTSCGLVLLPDPLVSAVTAATVYRYSTTGTALTTDELTALEIEDWRLYWRGGCWPGGARAVRLTYTHGYATPPREIKRAALILAVEQLTSGNVSARATQQTNENGTFNLAVPGWRDGQYFGLPEVDAVLAREAAKWRTPQVG